MGCQTIVEHHAQKHSLTHSLIKQFKVATIKVAPTGMFVEGHAKLHRPEIRTKSGTLEL